MSQLPETRVEPNQAATAQRLFAFGLPLGLLVLVICVGLWCLNVVRKTSAIDVRATLESVRDGSVTGLRTWFVSQERIASTWADQRETAQCVAALVALQAAIPLSDELRDSEALSELRTRLRPVCEKHGFIDFVVVDQNGINVGALLNESVGLTSLLERTDFVPRVLAGETVVTKPFAASIALPGSHGEFRIGQPTMFCAAPVRDGDGIIVAALCFRIRPEVDFTRILKIGRPGASGETFSFGKDGVLLSGSRFSDDLVELGLVPDQVGQDEILHVHITDPGGNLLTGHICNDEPAQRPMTEMVASAVQGITASRISSYRDYRGVPVVGAWTWLPEYEIGIATEMDSAEAWASARSVEQAMYGIFGLLTCASIAAALTAISTRRKSQSLRRNAAFESLLRKLTTTTTTTTQSSMESAMDDLLSQCVELIVRWRSWSIGHSYVNRGDGAFAASNRWFSQLPNDSPALSQEACDHLISTAGETLRRVKAAGEPVVVHDVRKDPNTSRRGACQTANFRSEYLLPVVCDGETVAVFDFFSLAPASSSEATHEDLRTLCVHLGRIIAHRRDELLLKFALHDLNQQQHALDEHAFVTVADVRGDIIFANDKFCDISGYSRDELLGQNHRMVKSDEHSPEFFREMWKTIGQGRVWRGEVKNRAKDGSSYWVEATIVPFKDDTGRNTKYVALRTDISRAKFAEEEIRRANAVIEARSSRVQAQQEDLLRLNADLRAAHVQSEEATKAKSEFLANMSHEIRTPMTAILGFAETVADNIENPENIDAMATVRRNGEYLLTIINDILDLSKIEARKMEVEIAAHNPCEIVAEVAALVKARAEGKGLAFEVEFIGDVPETIQTDPTRLRQILINLVGNAIKFTEEGGVKLISSLVQDGDSSHFQFDVLDTGIGMTSEQRARLFQPFSQADTSTTRKFGGTGLGLTISKRFAELLGGDITIAESEEGVGTRFRATVTTGSLDGVKMLVDPKAATVTSSEQHLDAPQADLTGRRVLLAEDGPDNQRLISFVLRKAGAEVVVQENGKLALDAALAARDGGNAFDCILMDMQMPVMSGYEATAALRDAGYTGTIIALTAHAMVGDREKCIVAGCDDFANKPIERAKLICAIARHSQRDARRLEM